MLQFLLRYQIPITMTEYLINQMNCIKVSISFVRLITTNNYLLQILCYTNLIRYYGNNALKAIIIAVYDYGTPTTYFFVIEMFSCMNFTYLYQHNIYNFNMPNDYEELD